VQFSLRLVTQPQPGTWARVLVTIVIIVILAAAGWAWYGPPGVIVALTSGGALARLTQFAPRGALARGGGR
jgi:cell division protein FtsW (lipid II flippase)